MKIKSKGYFGKNIRLTCKKCGCIYDVESRQERMRMNLMSKYWKVGKKNCFDKKCYYLYFSQFYEENDKNIVASFVQDETDENVYIYTSKELNVEYDTIIADSVEDAKQQIEDMLVEHWEDELDYFQSRIKAFQNDED